MWVKNKIQSLDVLFLVSLQADLREVEQRGEAYINDLACTLEYADSVDGPIAYKAPTYW